ncbi:hypothetical protein HGM15179_019191 [Zosterops borbonicus]|uniref:Uncharacterized protein n=1 Tax=Zosterops borbonicus TaxID=364589 RepID=A0A8K1DA59_9PASS|nr:hypothetical protein HGM15179_019191 [Zosterops borbonicus]
MALEQEHSRVLHQLGSKRSIRWALKGKEFAWNHTGIVVGVERKIPPVPPQVRPHLQSCPSPGAQPREDVELQERAQRRLQDEQRDGAALLGGKAGTAGIVQPGQEKLWAELRVALQGLEGVTRKREEGLFIWAESDRTRGNGFKLKEERLDGILGRNCSLGGWGGPGIEFPEGAPGNLERDNS